MSSFILKNVNLDCRSINLHIVPLDDRHSKIIIRACIETLRITHRFT